MKNIIDGNNGFAADLYAEVASISKENIFFSPLSIHVALGMTYLGARERTAREMEEVLHLNPTHDQIAHSYGELIQALNNPGLVWTGEFVENEYQQRQVPAYQLAIANALWSMKKYLFLKSYISEVKERFDAELKELDFINAPEPSRKAINDWVEEKTNKKIRELIPRGFINEDTRLVLTNAIYFMSNWLKTFKEGMTQDLPFYLIKGPEVICPQMSQQDYFSYMETNDFQALSLSYEGNELEMSIFLPKRSEDLSKLEKDFTTGNLKKWMSKIQQHEVRVTLPKFKYSNAINLGEILNNMGMKQAFAWPGADFSGMSPGKELVISAVFHKAFVDVNEEGTEAAAATAIVAALGAEPFVEKPEPKIFKADHPFLFIIRHQKTEAILFMGRVINPIL